MVILHFVFGTESDFELFSCAFLLSLVNVARYMAPPEPENAVAFVYSSVQYPRQRQSSSPLISY